MTLVKGLNDYFDADGYLVHEVRGSSPALPPSVMPSSKKIRIDTSNITRDLSSGDKQSPSNFHSIINPLKMDENSNPASASSTENVNTANGGDSARKPLIYSKQMLLSLRDEDYCVRRPDDLIGKYYLSLFVFNVVLLINL